MLKITIELIPLGFGKPKKIAEAEIYNDGTGDYRTGNYCYEIYPHSDIQPEAFFSGTVKSFRRSLTVWDLVYRCLRKIPEIRDRNP